MRVAPRSATFPAGADRRRDFDTSLNPEGRHHAKTISESVP